MGPWPPAPRATALIRANGGTALAACLQQRNQCGFRVHSLRKIANTAPCMHAGSLATLAKVVGTIPIWTGSGCAWTAGDRFARTI
jgi:cytochrome c peroxidase